MKVIRLLLLFIPTIAVFAQTDTGSLSVENAAYMLTQREDLVAIIAGYTNTDYRTPLSQKVPASEQAALRVKSVLSRLASPPDNERKDPSRVPPRAELRRSAQRSCRRDK